MFGTLGWQEIILILIIAAAIFLAWGGAKPSQE